MDKVYIIGRDEIPQTLLLDTPQTLKLTFVALPGVSAELSMEVRIASEGCELDIAGVYVCSGSDKLSLHLNVRHLTGGSISRQLFKGIVEDKASAAFDGLIYVARDAQKTRAYQASHSILLSAEAKALSQPQLEIYADDVECSHGSTSGFLAEDERFYMRSRGIPESEALYLQQIAFLASVASRLPSEIAEELYSSLTS